MGMTLCARTILVHVTLFAILGVGVGVVGGKNFKGFPTSNLGATKNLGKTGKLGTTPKGKTFVNNAITTTRPVDMANNALDQCKNCITSNPTKWQCKYPCDSENGRFIDGTDHMRVINGELQEDVYSAITETDAKFSVDPNSFDAELDVSTSCGTGFQCVQNCCQLCGNGQACRFGSVAHVLNTAGVNLLNDGVDYYSSNAVPAGYTENNGLLEVCPAGIMCPSGLQPTNCDTMAASYQDATTGLGIYDGIYCPEGTGFPIGCPEGNYCPDSKTIKVCPAGYFCPPYTLHPIACWGNIFESASSSCPEGSSRIGLRISLQILMYLILALLIGGMYLFSKSTVWSHLEKDGKVPLAELVPLAKVIDKKHDVAIDSKVEVIDKKHGVAFHSTVVEDEELSIDFKDLSLVVEISGEPKNILNSLSGSMKSGQTTALMGASGAGKTSLLNALSGRASYGKVYGEIYLNGQVGSIKEHSSIVGFVPQDDEVHPDLTVRENLLYAGIFRSKRGTLPWAINERASEVMKRLEMEHIKDSIVGGPHGPCRGISGGQRKRVNIGLELMAKPRVLFLDEPTSGLDAHAAVAACRGLTRLAKEERVNVICVIHQPRFQIYNSFDQVILLGQGGHMVWTGTPQSAPAYFKKLKYTSPEGVNFADTLLDISSGTLVPDIKEMEYTKDHENGEQLRREFIVNEWTKLSKSKAKHFETFDTVKPKDIPANRLQLSMCGQFFYLFWRSILKKCRTLKTFVYDLLLVLVAVYVVAMLGGDYWDNFTNSMCTMYPSNETILLFDILYGVVVGIVPLRTFGDGIHMRQREVSSGYSLLVIFLVGNVVDILLMVIYAMCSAVIYWEIRKPIVSFWGHFVILFLAGWINSAWAYLISIIVPKASTILTAGLFFAISGGVFGLVLSFLDLEAFHNDHGTFVQWLISTISSGRWITEWIFVSQGRALPPQYGYTISTAQREALGNPTENYACYIGQAQDFYYGYDDLDTAVTQSTEGWWWPVPYMFIIGVFLRLLGLIAIYSTKRAAMGKRTYGTIIMDIYNSFRNDVQSEISRTDHLSTSNMNGNSQIVEMKPVTTDEPKGSHSDSV